MSALPACQYTVVKDGPGAAQLFKPTPFAWINPEQVKRRDWLFGKHYIRNYVTATIGRRGGGKTARTIVEALAMITGRDLLKTGQMPEIACRIWYIGEDTKEEIQTRFIAACAHYGITEGEIAGRLFCDSVFDLPRGAAKVATLKSGTVTPNEAAIGAFKAGIEKMQIDVLVLDPLKKFHGVKENDNDMMDEVMSIFSEIALERHIAIEVLHHTRKPSQGNIGNPMTVDDGRGADAIIAAARSARIVNGLSAKDAPTLGVEALEAWRYTRIDSGKSNMAPPGESAWGYSASEIMPCGESVGVLKPWKIPDAFTDITVADRNLAAQLAATGEYRADARSSNWFGYALAKALNIPIARGDDGKVTGAAQDIAKVKNLIKTWIKHDVLRIKKRPDADSKEREFVVSGVVVLPVKSALSDDE